MFMLQVPSSGLIMDTMTDYDGSNFPEVDSTPLGNF